MAKKRKRELDEFQSRKELGTYNEFPKKSIADSAISVFANFNNHSSYCPKRIVWQKPLADYPKRIVWQKPLADSN